MSIEAISEESKVAVFKGKKIRKVLIDNEWWFSIVDVVSVLTDSTNPRDYWFKMKTRVEEEDAAELSTFCRQLKLESTDGKKYSTDCANTEGLFRIIQSIPSPKAEPFKLPNEQELTPKSKVAKKSRRRKTILN